MRVLVSAYACEPNKGSEPGVGWNWARQIARFAEAWVITRANNRPVIEAELARHPEPNLHFVYIDLPPWAKGWKRGIRGVHLYYLLWQLRALAVARKLLVRNSFDLVHHLTFVNDWMPTYMAFLPLPLVWGPMGSNAPVPRGFLPRSWDRFRDAAQSAVRSFWRSADPVYRLGLRRSRKIILISARQRERIPFRGLPTAKMAFLAANGVETAAMPARDGNTAVRVFTAGTLTPIKGGHLSLRAFAGLRREDPSASLAVAGDGRLRRHLSSLAMKLGIEDSVTFLGNLERTRVLELMGAADIFLFPSFEGGGMVVLEAMAAGLPVVCLDWGGPGEMVTGECGIKVPVTTPEETVLGLEEALRRLAADPELRRRMGEAGRRRVAEHYSWGKKGAWLERLYLEVVDAPNRRAPGAVRLRQAGSNVVEWRPPADTGMGGKR